MREQLDQSSDDDEMPDDLSAEQRILRKQRLRLTARIEELHAAREHLTEQHEQVSLLRRILTTLGARARIHTEMTQRELELRIVMERESAAREYNSYVAPIDFELDDFDNSQSQSLDNNSAA